MRRFLVTLVTLVAASTAALAAHDSGDSSIASGGPPETDKIKRADSLDDHPSTSNGRHPETDKVERAVLFDDLVLSKPGYALRSPYANDVAAADPRAVLGE